MSDYVFEGINENGTTYIDFVSLHPHQKTGKGSKVETLPPLWDNMSEERQQKIIQQLDEYVDNLISLYKE